MAAQWRPPGCVLLGPKRKEINGPHFGHLYSRRWCSRNGVTIKCIPVGVLKEMTAQHDDDGPVDDGVSGRFGGSADAAAVLQWTFLTIYYVCLRGSLGESRIFIRQ